MNRGGFRVFRWLCTLMACVALMSAAQSAERRVALVIGNSAYKHEPLFNPGHDARLVAQSLRESGFTVTELRNLNQMALRRAIRDFGDEIAKGGIGLFYYAGHGMQLKGRNFLIPTGNDIQREDEIADQAVDVGLVLEKMRTANNLLNILILDACRNNPFGPQLPAASGLATMDAPPRTIIAYSTAPGQVAADGTGDNSVYTKHLVAHMREPGVKLEDVFKRVRTAVRQESGGRQVPWENTSLEADFYFKAPDPRVIAAEQDERRKEQHAAIERAVQEALKRERQAAPDRARLEREIAERVAVERAAAERAAAERIAAIERAAEAAIARAMQGQPQPAATPPRPAGGAAERVAAPKPAPEARPAQAGAATAKEPVKLALAAPNVASITADRAAALPKVGDSWTYKVTTRDYGNVSESKSTSTVGAVTDGEIHLGRGKPAARFNHDWNLLYNRTNDGIERTYDPYMPLFSFPLEPGKTWQGKYKMARSDGRRLDFDMSVTVEGWESVTVPAGTFRAMKLSSINWYRRTDIANSVSGRIVVNRWYVPEVKRFVKSETLDMGNNNIVYLDNTFELISYKVQ